MKFHTIGGLPRSGSTLLCNILNQNPNFHASSTSILTMVVNSVTSLLSNTEEFKSYLIHDQKEAERMVRDGMKGYLEGWYSPHKNKTVFDKGRGWGHSNLQLLTMYPDAKIFVMVRDLRNIAASVEKQHQKFPLLDGSGNYLEKTLWQRVSNMFSDDGLIGSPLNGVEDLIRRKPKNVRFIKYEDLVLNPQKTLETIYSAIGEPLFAHNFNDVKNTAIDVDGLYLNKFPHKGEGKVVPSDPDAWKEYISDDLANEIMTKGALYNKTFGYE